MTIDGRFLSQGVTLRGFRRVHRLISSEFPNLRQLFCHEGGGLFRPFHLSGLTLQRATIRGARFVGASFHHFFDRPFGTIRVLNEYRDRVRVSFPREFLQGNFRGFRLATFIHDHASSDLMRATFSVNRRGFVTRARTRRPRAVSNFFFQRLVTSDGIQDVGCVRVIPYFVGRRS